MILLHEKEMYMYMLSERSQIEKATCCMIPLAQNVKNRQVSKPIRGYQGLGDGGGE